MTMPSFKRIPSPLGIWRACLLAGAVAVTASASPSTKRTSNHQHQQQRRADVSACKLPADNSVDLSSGFGFAADCAPSTGTLRAFMFFVDFSDQEATGTGDDTPEALRDFFVPGAAEWYATASYGALALNVTADTSRFYRMPATAASYGWDRGLTYEVHEQYIQDALDGYADGGGSAAGIDADVLYVVPTRAAALISFSPTFMGDVATRAGTHVAKKAVTFGADAYEAWQYLVLNHETGHTMCLPDLYPLDGRATGLFVGGWDLMGYINGPSPDYLAWNKWRLGWLADAQVGCVDGSGSTAHTLSPVEVSSSEGAAAVADSVKAVVVRHNDTAVLVAEARSRLAVDEAACAVGVLLYTVTTDTGSGEGPVQVVDANPGSGGCADDELNDATLTLDGTSTYSVPGWGVTVTVTGRDGDAYAIQVDVA
ncbi:hypothetical protein SLS62_009884 [Diatrype stigma]|uniref:Uncharacterized protein n=1 Tax=Diatrype stigma TaxID=117547 RepID=A0AAN9UDZ3_9PEZI